MARDAKFSHHALDSFRLVKTSGWCAFFHKFMFSHQTGTLSSLPPLKKPSLFLVQDEHQTDCGWYKLFELTFHIFTVSVYLVKWPGADVVAATTSPTAWGIFTSSYWYYVTVSTSYQRYWLMPGLSSRLKTKHWSSSINQE